MLYTKEQLRKRRKQYNKTYWLKNKNRITDYRLDHKVELAKRRKKYDRAYWLKNKTKIIEYRLKHKNKLRKQRKKYNKTYRSKHKIEYTEYRLKHKDKIAKWNKAYKLKNREKLLKQYKEYYLKNREKTAKYNKKYSKLNKKELNEKANIYRKKLREKNIRFKIKGNLRSRINQAIRSNRKSASTMFLIGCSVDYFLYHMQCCFTKGMNWDNYGAGFYGKGMEEWHVDHIKPCASFDLSKPSQQRKCFHYTNMQPLWAKDNLKKRREEK